MNDPAAVVRLIDGVMVPVFLCYVVWKATMDEFRQFVDALHSPGASVLVGYVILVTGVIMMKIMLYDDGKYVVGAGAGILAKSLNGTENAGATSQTTSSRTTTETKEPL